MDKKIRPWDEIHPSRRVISKVPVKVMDAKVKRVSTFIPSPVPFNPPSLPLPLLLALRGRTMVTDA